MRAVVRTRAAALLLTVALHVVLLWLLLSVVDVVVPQVEPILVCFCLPERPARTPPEVLPAPPETAPDRAAPLPIDESLRRPSPADRATPSTSLPWAPSAAAPHAGGLNLTVPAEYLEPPTIVGPGWVFDRKLARRLDEARRKQAARARLAGRRHARDGLDADAYARSAALGEKVKTDAGCYELREDPDYGGTRWWREACTDTTQSEWEQPPMDADQP